MAAEACREATSSGVQANAVAHSLPSSLASARSLRDSDTANWHCAAHLYCSALEKPCIRLNCQLQTAAADACLLKIDVSITPFEIAIAIVNIYAWSFYIFGGISDSDSKRLKADIFSPFAVIKIYIPSVAFFF